MKITGTRTTRIPETFCPLCFALLSGTTAMTNDKEPEPGDFTVCLYCAAVLIFGPRMELEKSSLMDIPEHSRLPFAQTVQTVKKIIEDEKAKQKRPLT
jgi:hypothetical protein